MLGGKRLKSPSGFQSERCHQHMCSRHVGGGGSISEGASLSDLLRVTPHSGNFISHNRALKPPLRTSFTPTAAPHQFPFLLRSSALIFLSPFLSTRSHPSILQTGSAAPLELSHPHLLSRFRVYELSSLFLPSILRLRAALHRVSLFLSLPFLLSLFFQTTLTRINDST